MSPREYVEHQLHMSEDEKEWRKEFFAELFAEDDKKREQEMMGVHS